MSSLTGVAMTNRKTQSENRSVTMATVINNVKRPKKERRGQIKVQGTFEEHNT